MGLLTRPFGNMYVVKNREKVKLDCVYILTMKNRKMPVTALEDLLLYTDEINLLFSDEPACWFNDADQRVRAVCVSKTDFAVSYRESFSNISSRMRPDFDIPVKRSFALHDARKNGKKHILLLDDDILLTKTAISTALNALANDKSIVGFHVVDYADISIIDHIECNLNKAEPCISMTGSCMFLNVQEVIGDFPFVYNEDLFFYLQQPFAECIVSGGVLKQIEKWDKINPDRIVHEQFGDLIYGAFKNRFTGKVTDPINWSEEIERGTHRINELYRKTDIVVYKKALKLAYYAIREIDINEIYRFVNDCNLANWVLHNV